MEKSRVFPLATSVLKESMGKIHFRENTNSATSKVEMMSERGIISTLDTRKKHQIKQKHILKVTCYTLRFMLFIANEGSLINLISFSLTNISLQLLLHIRTKSCLVIKEAWQLANIIYTQIQESKQLQSNTMGSQQIQLR